MLWQTYSMHTVKDHSLSGACQVDVAVSTSSRHADLSNHPMRAGLLSPGRNWEVVDRPQLSSAKIVSVYQLCDTSLWEDPECTTEELWNGFDWGLRCPTKDRKDHCAINPCVQMRMHLLISRGGSRKLFHLGVGGGQIGLGRRIRRSTGWLYSSWQHCWRHSFTYFLLCVF